MKLRMEGHISSRPVVRILGPAASTGTERLVDPFSLDGTTGAAETAVAPWSLDRMREEITRVDEQLLVALARRVRLTRVTASREDARGAAPVDPAREAAAVRRAAEQADAIGLDAEAIRDLYWRIVKLARPARRGTTEEAEPIEG